MAVKSAKRTSSRQRRRNTPLSSMQAATLTGIAVAVGVVLVVVSLMRQERALKGRDAWMYRIPWDASWPALTISDGATNLRVDVARALYAFAGKNADVLQYIPCHCGCQAQGHHSSADCYVKQRAPDACVTEWDTHGLTCRVGANIPGNVMLWREKGKRVSAIRDDIDHEYASREPGTFTPRPPPEH